MSYFQNLSQLANDQDQFTQYIIDNMAELYSIYNSAHNEIISQMDDIDSFILLKSRAISNLEYNPNINSFILILLDLCERLNLQASIPVLLRIIYSKGIRINKRMSAGLLFLYPKPNNADELVAKLNPICDLLQDAIETEEDDSKKAVITFLNYYSAVIESTHIEYSRKLKANINQHIKDGTYPFLNEIVGLSDIDPSSVDVYDQIQSVIDKLLNPESSTLEDNSSLLIEDGTEYSSIWESIPCNFDNVRSIAVQNGDAKRLRGRGVEILQDETSLYTYLRSYGPMHKAKMLSCFEEPFPQSFDDRVTIIDWGCGQGLASMVFIEKFGVNRIDRIILIEPSDLAIRRAALHCRRMAPRVKLTTICKKLDDLSADDFSDITTPIVINLFSNILDIDDYSPTHLINIVDAIRKRYNYYICASPHIDDIRTAKIDTFKEHFTNEATYQLIQSSTNTKYGGFWMCNNFYRNSQANHGDSDFCKEFDEDGCINKWTRVLRVFKV